MQISKEYLDVDVLDKGFTLSGLWTFREQITKVKLELEEAQCKAIREGYATTAVAIGNELHYVNKNLDYVDYVMSEKEGDIFLFTEYGDSCLN